jgi:hypothetical protein
LDHHWIGHFMTGILAVVAGSYPGAGTPAVSISDRTIRKIAIGGSATATYQITDDGTVRNHNNTVLESWLNGAGGSVANYEVRATVISGPLTSGTTGTWLSCSTTPAWSLTNSAQDNSTDVAVILIEIRLASTGVIQDSATITLQAENDNTN